MSATFAWVEYLATAGDTATPTNLNFGSTISANLVPSTYPITAGENSYEKWVKAHFSGSFTRIENLQFWKSAGDYVPHEAVSFKVETTYATPTTLESTTSLVPTESPASANVSIGGSMSGSLTATGDSDFIVLQNQIGQDAGPGATNQKTFSLSYDEI